MPPRVKITKEDIIKTATALVRVSGEQAINARAIAAALSCSTQPIFSNFASMDELRRAVIDRAESLCAEYLKREVQSGVYPPYKANGMAYIRFAKEERELFRLLYMRDRSAEVIPEETELTNQMENFVHNNTGLEGKDTKLFHLEMWAYVHGVATMFATGYLDLDWELVSKMLTDAYQGLKKQYAVE
ncbi:MAG: WHG domain-containing protein [Clostridiales bacterium]|nr:WHG domain-containing protein [Clostridiales bacterium]